MANEVNNAQIPSEKLPPQNIEAEKSLLGCLIIDKNAIVKVVDYLEPGDFYKKTHQQIYEAICDLFERGEGVDLLAISNRLKEKGLLEEIGGNSYLTELANSVPNALHVLNYAKIVQRKRILRDLIDASYEIAQLGYNESEDIDVLLDKAEKRIFSIAQKSLTQRFVSLKEELEEAFERIDKISKQRGALRGTPTGFVDLDNLLSGLQKSDLIILASRPSIGKSSLALNIAANVAINHKMPVGIFSLEMSKDQIVDRLIASCANVDLWRLRTGFLSSEGENNDFERIQRALGILSEAPIFIDDAATSNVMQMRAMARRLQAEKGLSLLIIDYLQLIEPRNPKVSMVQQMTEVSRALKSLARELNVPVLALSQLSRAVEQRTPPIPRLSDLRESGCLTGDTLIIRADTGERVPIEKLQGKASIPVFSLGEDYKLHIGRMTKVFPTGKKIVFELQTRTGRKIKASANHPFWTLFGWKRLDELKVGDYIALPRKLRHVSPKNEMTNEELILLAHLLGGGCILPRQPFHYTSSDKKNIKIVQKMAENLFNIQGKIIRQKNWYRLYLSNSYRLTRRKHHPITIWFKERVKISLLRSWEKEIPELVFQCSEDKIALFLKHLWSTDGNLSWKNPSSKKGCSIYYSTTSPKLAEQVQHLLLILGIQSILRKTLSKRGYRPIYQVEVLRNANDAIPKQLWHYINRIPLDNDLSWLEFARRCNIPHGSSSTRFKSVVTYPQLRKIVSVFTDPYLLKLVNSDIFWDNIISIKKLGIKKVYDATVEPFHNFVANDIIVENSIEQDADVVLFIYREDRYNPDTIRKNIADIIVAKHRNGPVGKVELFFDDSRATFRNLEKREPEEEIISG